MFKCAEQHSTYHWEKKMNEPDKLKQYLYSPLMESMHIKIVQMFWEIKLSTANKGF